jgi:hypothetical protein
MLARAINNAKNHVFGSIKASIILSTNLQQPSNTVYGRYSLLLFEMFVLNSRLVFLRYSHSEHAFNWSYDYIL